MKNVRIFYTKTDRMKFVSHLDMNRLMSRIIMRADIPVWYTEGFNQRIYINYAVPLSLGFEGLYEIIDIRLTDDNYPLDTLPQRLNGVSVPGIELYARQSPAYPQRIFALRATACDLTAPNFSPSLKIFYRGKALFAKSVISAAAQRILILYLV